MLIDDPLKIDSFYTALVKKDESYLDIFFAGVKTTLVLCVSTCPAKKPLKKNVEFFSTLKPALRAGYRPCKICKPLEKRSSANQQVIAALRAARTQSKEKITEYQLAEFGVCSDSLRKWFNNEHDITYQAYHRMLRLNTAFKELKLDKLDESLSGEEKSKFGFGYTKKTHKKKNYDSILLIDRFDTPLGQMFVCATEEGVCLAEFTDRRMLETELGDLQNRLNAKVVFGQNQHIHKLKKQLYEYFSGHRKEFSVQLFTPGTDFQKQVWKELIKIPFGAKASYQEQAKRIGNPKAVRAVATANGSNRISILIPCHRVIGKNGDMTGYGGGIDRKKYLLELEERYS